MQAQDKYEWIRQYTEGKLSGEELKNFETQVANDSEFAEMVQVYTVEQYVGGTLTGTQLTIFEQALQNDTALVEEVALHREVQTLMKQDAKQKLKNELKTLFATEEKTSEQQPAQLSPKVVQMKERRRWMWAAAAILFLIVGPVSFLLFNRPVSEQALFAEYFEAPPMNMSLRGPGAQDKAILQLQQQAQFVYKSGRYNQALPLFQQLTRLDAERPEYHLYTGICLLADGYAAESLYSFQQLAAHPIYNEPAEWYLALAHLQLKKRELAHLELGKIAANTQHEFSGQAKELLQKL